MKALLLAGGLGTRLLPLTKTTPKCLVSIDGRPLIDRWIRTLLTVDRINKIYVNLHHLPELVVDFVYSQNYSKPIEFIYEPELLGTGGTLLKFIELIKDEEGWRDALVVHADNFYSGDIDELLSGHKNRPPICVASTLVFPVEDPEKFGIFSINDDCVVEGFWEKSRLAVGNLANSAIYIFSKNALIEIAKYKNIKDVSCDVLPMFVNRLFVIQTMGEIIDIGTPEQLALARTLFSNKN